METLYLCEMSDRVRSYDFIESPSIESDERQGRVNAYALIIGPSIEDDIEEMAYQTGISKSEVLRRSLLLYKHALSADHTTMEKDEKFYYVVVR